MATPKKGYWIDGKRLPSVTTVLGRFKESGALMHWAFSQGLEQGEAIGRDPDNAEAPNLYKKRDEAANAGTLAHEMVEAYIRGQDHLALLSDVPEILAKQALNAFQQFREWHENNKIEIISDWQEIQMVSEKHRYGGTPDAIGRNVSGELVLLDWKTSNGVYSDYLLQLAAYKELWEENYPDRPINGGFYICRFSKDFPDFAAHFYGDLDQEWKMFKLLREAYGIDKEVKKRTK